MTQASRRATAVAWAVLLLMALRAVGGAAIHDFRSEPLVGDEASHVLQAISLAGPGHNLSFDAGDTRRWRALHWAGAEDPRGLFFQKYSHGYAFAKPYGYSLWLAPWMMLFGTVRGFALANAALLLALTAVTLALLRRRFSGPVVPLATIAIVFSSYAYFYAYVAYVELFLAVLVGLVLYAVFRTSPDSPRLWPILAFAVSGFLVAEKLSLAVVLIPVLLVVLHRRAVTRERVLLVALGGVAVLVAVLPYLRYSDFHEWNPYAGDRYYLNGPAPWDGGPPAARYTGGNDGVSLSRVPHELTTGYPDKAESTLWYFIGRNTGLVVFVPVSVVVLVLAVSRRRRLPSAGMAVMAGIAAYVLLYTVLFSDNYYGGGQSFGNRYFLQILPTIPALAVAARVDGRKLLAGSLGSILFGLVVLWPHHRSPDEALIQINRVSLVQRVFPFESNQKLADYFRCGYAPCPKPSHAQGQPSQPTTRHGSPARR